jgi:hypothetical protein
MAALAFFSQTEQHSSVCGKISALQASRSEPRMARRSAAAREAVLLRSRGRCENPRCIGDVQDVTDSGAPILEGDHVRDLAKGGPDKPDQMIALCPNCHATKTRGRTREKLQRELFVVAEQRHRNLLHQPPPAETAPFSFGGTPGAMPP